MAEITRGEATRLIQQEVEKHNTKVAALVEAAGKVLTTRTARRAIAYRYTWDDMGLVVALDALAAALEAMEVDDG